MSTRRFDSPKHGFARMTCSCGRVLWTTSFIAFVDMECCGFRFHMRFNSDTGRVEWYAAGSRPPTPTRSKGPQVQWKDP